MKKVEELLQGDLASILSTDPETALKRAFVMTDEMMQRGTPAQRENKIDAELAGTTAIVVLMQRNPTNGHITAWTACSGDSRAVLGLRQGGGYTYRECVPCHAAHATRRASRAARHAPRLACSSRPSHTRTQSVCGPEAGRCGGDASNHCGGRPRLASGGLGGACACVDERGDGDARARDGTLDR